MEALPAASTSRRWSISIGLNMISTGNSVPSWRIAPKVKADTHGAYLGVLHITGTMRYVAFTKALGDQHLDRLAEHAFARKAEQGFRRCVDRLIFPISFTAMIASGDCS